MAALEASKHYVGQDKVYYCTSLIQELHSVFDCQPEVEDTLQDKRHQRPLDIDQTAGDDALLIGWVGGNVIINK